MGKNDVSYSRKYSYAQCERKAFVLDKHKLAYQSASNRAMDLGTAVHKLLENAYEVGDKLSDFKLGTNAYQAIIKGNGENMEVVIHAMNIVQQYRLYLARLTKEKHWFTDLVVMAKEEKFSAFGVSGVLDLRVVDTKTGKQSVIDYKTTKGDLTQFPHTMLGSEQFPIYQRMANLLHYPVTQVIVVALKTKMVSPVLELTKTGKVSTARKQNTSYEVFTNYLNEKMIPLYKYDEYLEWLLNAGANNKIYPISYSQLELNEVYRVFMHALQRIEQLNTLEDCTYNRTYTCPTKCPIYNQCVGMSNGIDPDFTSLMKRREQINEASKGTTTVVFGKGR